MKRTQATAIGSLSILLWGTLALLTQLTENRIPPFQLLSMTFATAWLLMLAKGLWLGPSPRHLLRQPAAAWVLGVGGLFGYHACYFAAMALAPAVEVSLLAYLWPLLIVLFSALLPGHRLLWVHVAGALLAMAGCWLLLDRGEEGFQWRYWPGYGLALGCALLWSGYSVLNRLLAQVKGEAPADAVGWYCAVTALLGLICHLLWESWVWPEGSLQWLGILGLGLGPVGIAFFTWDYGIKRGDLRLLGVLSYGAPLISTLLLVVFGYAEFSWKLAISSLLIVGGALLAGAGPLWQRRSLSGSERLEVQ